MERWHGSIQSPERSQRPSRQARTMYAPDSRFQQIASGFSPTTRQHCRVSIQWRTGLSGKCDCRLDVTAWLAEKWLCGSPVPARIGCYESIRISILSATGLKFRLSLSLSQLEKVLSGCSVRKMVRSNESIPRQIRFQRLLSSEFRI